MDIDVIVERKSFDVELEVGNPVVEVKAPDHYNGPFDIFPSDEDQIIPVKEKMPTEDICVKGITGEETITQNGTYNVLTDKTVDVDVPVQYKDGKNDFSGSNLLALITHGTEYLTTNFFPPANTNYLSKFRVIKAWGNPAVFGTIYKPPGCEFRINIFAGSLILQKSRYAVSIGISSGGINIDHDISVVSVIPVNSPCPDSDNPSTYPLAIFGQYAGNSTGNVGNTEGHYEFYGLKCYDQNGNLVKKYVPWLDDNNVPCVRELVDDEYFYNVGIGTFGYIDLEGNVY